MQTARTTSDHAERCLLRLAVGFAAIAIEKNPLQARELAISAGDGGEQRDATAASRVRGVAAPAQRRRCRDMLDAPPLKVSSRWRAWLDRFTAIPKRARSPDPAGSALGIAGHVTRLGRGRRHAFGSLAQHGAESGSIVAAAAPKQRSAIAFGEHGGGGIRARGTLAAPLTRPRSVQTQAAGEITAVNFC